MEENYTWKFIGYEYFFPMYDIFINTILLQPGIDLMAERSKALC